MSGVGVSDYRFAELNGRGPVARAVRKCNVVSVTAEDDLNTALQRLTSLNIDELPVVDPADPGRLLGMLSRRETIAFYNRRVIQHREEAGSK